MSTTTPRLYVEDDLSVGLALRLDRDASHYLVTVMRRAPGDAVRLFNGRDGEWIAEVTDAHRKAAVLTPVEQSRVQTRVPDLWLLFAPVKRAKTDLIVEKAVEMGVARICPVETRRTQSDRIRLDRFEAIAREAAEQTERLDLPAIDPLARLDTVLDGWDRDRVLVYADEAGDEANIAWGGQAGRAAPMPEQIASLRGRPAAILAGPEGGFTREERDHLRSLDFVCPVTLGPRILRAETAVIAALTVWQSVCGDWRDRE